MASQTKVPSLRYRHRPMIKVFLHEYRPRGGAVVRKWAMLASVAAGTAVFVAALAGKDDIRRFWLMHNM